MVTIHTNPRQCASAVVKHETSDCIFFVDLVALFAADEVKPWWIIYTNTSTVPTLCSSYNILSLFVASGRYSRTNTRLVYRVNFLKRGLNFSRLLKKI